MLIPMESFLLEMVVTMKGMMRMEKKEMRRGTRSSLLMLRSCEGDGNRDCRDSDCIVARRRMKIRCGVGRHLIAEQ